MTPNDRPPYEYRFTLDHGVFTASVPARLSAGDLEDLEAIVSQILRTARRVAGRAADRPTDEEPPR